MKSLRARIAVTLVLAIISVVVLATATTFFVVRGLEDNELSKRAVIEIQMIAPLFAMSQSQRNAKLIATPTPGDRRERLERLLKSQLRDAGLDLDVVVSQPVGAPDPLVYIKLDEGWLALPYMRRPEGAFLALSGWIFLIGLGTVVVALAFAHRITRHLGVLEKVAATIDADGVVPRLPETGPAELKATARALNTMTARLKNAAESRMRLVAAAGHDLRTPMTRMRLRAEFLPDEDRAAWLHDLEELDRIADSAIQLVRVEVEGEQMQTLRLDQLMIDICKDLSLMSSQVKIVKTDAVTILSPPLALTRALRNLIINAATHGGGASVTVEALDTSALIKIDDDGPGIPSDCMARVFEPFFRVDPSRRKSIPGAGLGLAIAKEIIERHGGKLTLSNRMPTGLRQEIRLARV